MSTKPPTEIEIIAEVLNRYAIKTEDNCAKMHISSHQELIHCAKALLEELQRLGYKK